MTQEPQKHKETPNRVVVPARVSVPLPSKRSFIQSLSEKPKLLYTIIGCLMTLLVLMLIITIISVTFAISSSRQSQLAKLQTAAEKAEQEQKEAEPKDPAVRVEQEQEEAEAKDPAEKAEQVWKEAKAKAAAEKAEQKRKEAEAKAAAEKAEQEQKEAEAKPAAERAEKEQLLQQLQELPDVWENRGLPFHGLAFSLPDSAFLWEIKEEVTINYTPFVILEHNDDKEKKIQLRNENHRVEFCYVTETGYINQNKQIEQSILTIELKENGLNFDWDQSWLSGINADRDKRRELNRILLAKLKVEIKGIGAKEIALLSPTKYTQADFENLLKGKTDNSFALWKQEGEGGKEFIVYEKDNVAMLLDFDEWVDNKGKHSVIDKKFRKILSSLGYSPNVHEDFSFIIQSSEENLNVKIESYPTSVEPLQKKAKEIEDQINKLKKQTPKNQRQIEFELKNLSAQIRSLTEQFALTPDHVTEKREKRTVLETKIKELQDEMKQVKVIDNKIYELKKDLDNKLKEIKQERFAWNNVRMEAFSIYLLKHDTKPEDVDKPENRLLLFEVKP